MSSEVRFVRDGDDCWGSEAASEEELDDDADAVPRLPLGLWAIDGVELSNGIGFEGV